jgi:hypothetical protein
MWPHEGGDERVTLFVRMSVNGNDVIFQMVASSCSKLP